MNFSKQKTPTPTKHLKGPKGRTVNSKLAEYPDVKIAGTNKSVLTPTLEQMAKLKRIKPSPPFTDTVRQAFRQYWETNNQLPKWAKDWDDFWSQVNIHHIIPRSLGGSVEGFENLVPVLKGEHTLLTRWWRGIIAGM